MFVYSKTILQFIQEIKFAISTILSKEASLKVVKNRFFDQNQKISYPIKVVIFNNKKMLGYFDSDFYELGFNECLLQTNKEQLWNIIRHELAHFLAFIKYGANIPSHGKEFKSICEELKWEEDVYRATFCVEKEETIVSTEQSRILRKVQKLLALGASQNKNEAELAMIKSQALLLKHHIDFREMRQDEEKLFLKRLLKQKRENAKMRAIALILETFFVNVVYNRIEDYIYLEILGDAVNIEIAEYVANVLEQEFENLWIQAKNGSQLKGQIAKNSFFLGIAKGYCNKINALKCEHNHEETKALIVIEKKLKEAKSLVYPKLFSTRSSAQYCSKSSLLGEQMGKKLNINPAINKSSNHTLLIT